MSKRNLGNQSRSGNLEARVTYLPVYHTTWYSLWPGEDPTLDLLEILYVFKVDFSEQTIIMLRHNTKLSNRDFFLFCLC